MQRCMDRYHVDGPHERGRIRVDGQRKFALDFGGQPVLVGVVQVNIKGCESAQNGTTDAAGRDDTDVHSLDVIGALDAVGYVPATIDDPFVRGKVVANESEDLHNSVLGDTDAVAIGLFDHGDAVADCCVEINVIRTDAGRDRELQFWRLRDPFCGQIGRLEWLGNHDVSARELPFWVVIKYRDAVACALRRVPGDGIWVEDEKNLGHVASFYDAGLAGVAPSGCAAQNAATGSATVVDALGTTPRRSTPVTPDLRA